MEEKGGKLQLTPGWLSRDMLRGEPPVIANGIVFGYGSGEGTDQAIPSLGLTNNTQERIPKSTHATLFALDARTGKELWNSGTQIASWNHWSGLSIANGQVYINTFDGYLYCFGLKK